MSTLFEAKPIKINKNPDRLTDEQLAKVNELREKRNALNNQASEVQKEIDNIILAANDFGSLEGKYFQITYDNEDNDNIIFCGPVTNVDRIYSRSCRIYVAKSLSVYQDLKEDSYFRLSLEINDDIELSHYESDAFAGKRKTTYVEITKEAFEEQIKHYLEVFNGKCS